MSDLSNLLPNDWHSGPRLYRLEGVAGSKQAESIEALLVERFAYVEQLCEGFVMELHVLCTEPLQSPRDLINAPVRLKTRLADGTFHDRGALVTGVSQLGADGGFTRLRLVLQPWIARLRRRRHSRVWQDKSVTQIIDDILGAYLPLAAWQWGEDGEGLDEYLAQTPQAGVQSYFVQYRQDDWTTVQQLLGKVGLAWRVEPIDREAQQGSFDHQVVFFAQSDLVPQDDTSRATAGGQGIRFHRAGATEEQDTVVALAPVRQLAPWGTTALQWDYRGKRAVSAESGTQTGRAAESLSSSFSWLNDFHHEHAAIAGPGLATDDLTHQARLRQQALDARAKHWQGLASVRSLRAGNWMAVTGFAQAGAEPKAKAQQEQSESQRNHFLLIGVRGVGINNLPTTTAMANVHHAPFTHPALRGIEDSELSALASAVGHAARVLAQRRAIAWRPMPAPLAPAFGIQSAIVVGPSANTAPDGQEVHTDGLGRIRVRFHWQEGSLADARPDNRLSCWVRVCYRGAGPGMGLKRTPRIGDEVLVGFLDSRADLPVVIGSVPNGQGEAGIQPTPGGLSASQGQADPRAVLADSTDERASAQGNLAAQGRSPAWHGGAAGFATAGSQAQYNAAALSGLKSNEWSGAGYSQLVWDDTPGQLRTQMATTQHATQLSLGHLIHQADNHRGSFRGSGFELRTDAFGALRARQGLLLSSYPLAFKQGVPAEPAFDNAPGMALMKQASGLAQRFNAAAQSHGTTTLASVRGSLKANQCALNDSQAPLRALDTALSGTGATKSLDEARADALNRTTAASPDKLPHMTDPVLTVSAKAGTALLAGQHLQWASNDVVCMQAGQDQDWAVGGQMRWHSAQSIGVLAGAINPGSTAAAGSGLTLVADKGPLDVQAQSGPIRIVAKDQIRIHSTHAHIDWAAAKSITLCTAAGAQITIDASGVVSQCPGTITVHALARNLVGPASTSYPLPVMPAYDLRLLTRFPISR